MCRTCGSPIAAPGCGCGNGKLAIQKLANSDCNCVGIQNIVQSQDGKNLIITLTDGTSLTFPLPAGQQGPAGAAGPAGPAGKNGILNLWNDFTTAASTGSGSPQIINPTSQIIKAGTLVNPGDSVLLRYVFSTTTPQNGQTAGLTLNGRDIIGSAIMGSTIGQFSGNNWNQLQYDVRVTLTGNTTAQVDSTQEAFAISVGGIVVGTGTKFQVTFSQTGLNFAVDQPLQALGQNGMGKSAVNYLQGSADQILTI